jgi:hypothetical protein
MSERTTINELREAMRKVAGTRRPPGLDWGRYRRRRRLANAYHAHVAAGVAEPIEIVCHPSDEGEARIVQNLIAYREYKPRVVIDAQVMPGCIYFRAAADDTGTPAVDTA